MTQVWWFRQSWRSRLQTASMSWLIWGKRKTVNLNFHQAIAQAAIWLRGWTELILWLSSLQSSLSSLFKHVCNWVLSYSFIPKTHFVRSLILSYLRAMDLAQLFITWFSIHLRIDPPSGTAVEVYYLIGSTCHPRPTQNSNCKSDYTPCRLWINTVSLVFVVAEFLERFSTFYVTFIKNSGGPSVDGNYVSFAKPETNWISVFVSESTSEHLWKWFVNILAVFSNEVWKLKFFISMVVCE